jgi:ABC-type uncharacterized transport system involved in gliding motility auxiliary subunit
MESIRKALPFIGLILLFIAVALFGIFYSGVMTLRDQKMIIAAAVGLLGVLLTVLGFQTRAFGPNLKYYLLYTVTSIFVIGSFAMIYLIVRNHSVEWDVTSIKRHSLHPRTVEYLQRLDQNIQITAFPAPDFKREVESFLNRYSRASAHVTTIVRNPYKDINEAKRFAENVALGDVFIYTGEPPLGEEPATHDYRMKKINLYGPRDLSESKVTNAVVEIMRTDQVKVYVLQGHGEISLEPSAPLGPFSDSEQPSLSYSGAERLLEDDMSLEVETLELARKGWVPEDCSLLIAAGPQTDLLPLEVQAITKYLEQGGRALILLDPILDVRVRFTEWARLLARWGIELKNDMVLEYSPISQLTGPTMLLVSRYGTHATVDNMRRMVQMQRARTVAPHDDRPSTLSVSELMYSSNMSWSEEIPKLLGTEEIQVPGPDRLKEEPLAVAVSMEPGGGESEQPTRLIVVGDADIFENQFLESSFGLFVNFINWLVAREDLIDIPAKEVEDTPIFPSRAQMRTVFTILVPGFPALIFFGGLGYVLIRRRVR